MTNDNEMIPGVARDWDNPGKYQARLTIEGKTWVLVRNVGLDVANSAALEARVRVFEHACGLRCEDVFRTDTCITNERFNAAYPRLERTHGS